MNTPNKGKLTIEQRSRLVEALQDETDTLVEQNARRIDELVARGMQISPITLMAAQVQALIHWVCPTEYQRARFDRDVQMQIATVLDESNVQVAKQQMDESAAKRAVERAEMEAAARGRRESGLYVPESAEENVIKLSPPDVLSPPS